MKLHAFFLAIIIGGAAIGAGAQPLALVSVSNNGLNTQIAQGGSVSVDGWDVGLFETNGFAQPTPFSLNTALMTGELICYTFPAQGGSHACAYQVVLNPIFNAQAGDFVSVASLTLRFSSGATYANFTYGGQPYQVWIKNSSGSAKPASAEATVAINGGTEVTFTFNPPLQINSGNSGKHSNLFGVLTAGTPQLTGALIRGSGQLNGSVISLYADRLPVRTP